MSGATEREGEIELTGEVRAVDVDAGVLALRLSDGKVIQARFAPEQEETVITALHERDRKLLRVRARLGLDRSGSYVRPVVVAEEVQLAEPPETKPIWEVLLEISESIPESEWSAVPTDMSYNLDHYLRGAPKRDLRRRDDDPDLR
jgi:hypothetical protein